MTSVASMDYRSLPVIVGDPIPFPNPTILVAKKGKLLVFTDDEDDHTMRTAAFPSDELPEERLVLITNDARYYELGEEPIRKAIFGQVLYGIVLEITPHQLNHKPIFRRTTTEVAIKVYYRDRLRSLQGRTQENPLMEITALQYLGDGHRGIVGQVECAMDTENIYSIMRYYAGGELFDRISSMNSPMSEPQARRFFKQLMQGIQRFQELGIAHRDLSLENILCKHALPSEEEDEDNQDNDQDTAVLEDEYAIIDFGMCLRLPRHPDYPHLFLPIKRQLACGKRNYMAPEILNTTSSSHISGSNSSSSSNSSSINSGNQDYFYPMLVDIWACGIILFMVLTGVPPIDIAMPSDERFLMVADGRLQDMVYSWGFTHLSPNVLQLIQGLLQVDPLQRLSVSEILQHPWMNMVDEYRNSHNNNDNNNSRMDEDEEEEENGRDNSRNNEYKQYRK